MTTAVENVSKRKRIYVGNLTTNVSTEDLTQLFGLEATPFLSQNCDVEIAVCEKTGKSKNFAFIIVPEHIHSELLKLNGIEFYGKQLVIEEAKTKPEDDKENKDNNKRKGRNNNRHGGYNNRGGYRRYRPNVKSSDLPKLSADDTFHLVDGGVNLVNRKFSPHISLVVGRALAAGVQKMVITGLKLSGSKSAFVMAKAHPSIAYAAVGVHPHFVKDDWNDSALETLEELVKNPEVVAVGECGLDFYRDYSPRNIQETAFEKQVQLAVRYQKALLVHERKSHEGIMDILRQKQYKSTLPPVIIHCFTGTVEQLKVYIEEGYYIGVTGFVCKAVGGQVLRDAIKDGTLPLHRIIIQTNAPYMTPSLPREEMDPVSQTIRDHCYFENEPCTLSIIVRCIAKCLSQDPRVVADTCTETSMKVFQFQKITE